ncbi:DUF484 family protein [Acidiferrobacter sp.]|uniref:DUF484 family protein n=1 Tax=Acidiferrobacter sp. TaxID=1872107 RepID=UPI00261DDE84|nr:DUF484 family protein [Acidiferrobacter sp.]
MKQSSEELSWEEGVARYLRDHPDYFEQHEDLLEVLRVPHAGRGAAVSLLERQAAVLRERLVAKDRERRDFLAAARENEALGERLHRLAVALIDAASLDDVFGSVYELGRNQLRLDTVTVLLGIDGGPLVGRAEFVSPDDARLRRALALSRGRPLCGPKTVLAEARSLLGADEARIASVALVALRDPVRAGVILLGSRDPERFPPGAGTLYLGRLGDLVMRAVARQLDRS